MSRETKKRSIRRRIMDVATEKFRKRGHDRLTTATIQLRVADLPDVLRLTFAELGEILNDIESESNGNINVGEVNDGSQRVTNNFYPVKVSRAAVDRERVAATKPTIEEHDKEWGIIMPGQRIFIPIGRKGTLKGEALYVLGARWGQLQSVEYVLTQLAGRVTDPRTLNPNITQLKNALREINGSLHPETGRRLKRIGKLTKNQIGISYKQPHYSAVLLVHNEKMRVGFITE